MSSRQKLKVEIMELIDCYKPSGSKRIFTHNTKEDTFILTTLETTGPGKMELINEAH